MKNTQPTFIIISPGFAKDEKDSTCLPLQQNLAKAINKKFPSIKIIILAFQYPFTQSEYYWYGNKVISFGSRNKGKIFTLLLWRKVWLCLKKIQQENNVKGLLSFWIGEGALIGKYFGKKYAIKHYCWILGQDAKKGNKHAKRMCSNPEQLIALSDFIANEFYKNYHALPSHIIPPGVEPAQFLKDAPERTIDILGAGSLITLKQYEVFINVVFKLKTVFPLIKVMLCGKGPEEQKLKKLIRSFSLENNITLIGEIPHHEVLAMMQQAKIFLHPSCYEGFGVVCIEALFAGAHVISFCKPMNNNIEHWDIVNNEEEMLVKSVEILQSNNIEYKTVTFGSMDDCAKKIVKLFGSFN